MNSQRTGLRVASFIFGLVCLVHIWRLATSPIQTPPPEFQKVAQKAAPAIIEITVFDVKGQLLRTGNAFFISRDGLIATTWTMVADAAYGVAKSPDGKIRNITGVLASDQQNDLA